jgi:hypothetical protein
MKLWFWMLHMCVCMHSRFVKNHLIWILEDGLLISEVVLSHSASPTLECLDEPWLPYPCSAGSPDLTGAHTQNLTRRELQHRPHRPRRHRRPGHGDRPVRTPWPGSRGPNSALGRALSRGLRPNSSPTLCDDFFIWFLFSFKFQKFV